ncbi:dTDP-4-amino-4,6-dideoxygalactose transaminase [Sphingomonas naasensis]|uniref:DegT/DnrJ/EryC1/StrS family aminotransferase n=1 Tax=Sphingomonas naasensis TaxID=1344951 RepID=A0A4S1WXU8_9SPHN|nr:DegT/DnrJ/EryC1/StrS family aminotransferase [Sphingomonas naasensis]NIJ19291.1 dTDP-4-amino-4,6-dideoxygalactose transaminase [Sphingomonas naasensis]TGX46466.1 DegT/DnrJ/EryC1/StrS family aminotransferase [Sphingomonas naasensis]
MKVPFIDISRWEPGFQQRWTEKVGAMSGAAQFIGGPEVAALEARLCETLGVGYAIGCANGTDAIQLGLRALDVGAGDVVLVPNATFWATFEAVVNVGATPVTVDISLADGGLDLSALEQAIARERPKAAIAVHLYGWASRDLKAIRQLCAREGVALLEDGAQCFGASLDGEPVLKGALISTTSFYPAKVLGAAGDAGAVFTDDAALADKVRRLGNHGRTAHYGYGDVGWNSRLDALQAAFLNISFDFLDARLASRRAVAETYRCALPTSVSPMPVPAGYVENGYCNVCLIEDAAQKARLEATLRENGIGFGNIYPGSMASQPGAKPYLKAHYGGDRAELLSRQVINLPLFAYMTSFEVDHVVATVRTLED